MTLVARNPDITFLDVETMKPRCTFNACREKFELCENHVSSLTATRGRSNTAKPVPVYSCRDCGCKVQETAEDRAEIT